MFSFRIDKKSLFKIVAFGIAIFSIFASYAGSISVNSPIGNIRTSGAVLYSAVTNSSQERFAEKTLVMWNNSLILGNCSIGDTFFTPCGLTFDQLNQRIYVIDRARDNIAILEPQSGPIMLARDWADCVMPKLAPLESSSAIWLTYEMTGV